MSDPRALEVARRELQRLGYLTHRVERFLLSDAVSTISEPRALALVSLKVGLLSGSLLALASALALGVANDLLRTAPADLLPLFVHLWPPLVLLGALGFVGTAGGFLFARRLFPRRSLEFVILGVAFVATGALFAWALYRAKDVLLELGRGPRVVAALLLPLVAAGVAKLLANGLLSLAIRLTRLTPRERLVSRRTILSVLGGALGCLIVVALAWPGRELAASPPSLPMAPGRPVVLIGLDGILARELDYLLARGALPEVARRMGEGGLVARYRRPEDVAPAELWTTLATGVEAARHGVGAVDGYRPAGLESTLWRSGPLDLWWRLEHSLGLAAHRPVLANRRRSFAFWELASRGGAPVAAVNWWSTFPATPVPGLVVAHGAFQLLASAGSGAVAPASRESELAGLAKATTAGPFGEALAAALAGEPAKQALDRAILPDRFYREAARLEAGARAIALYLPAIDLLAEGWVGGDVAFADLVRAQLVETDAALAAFGEDRTVLIVADPGRRGGGEGRLILLRPGCLSPGGGTPASGESSSGTAPSLSGMAPLASGMAPWAPADAMIEPRAVASILLRELGLPQSAELLPPADLCVWPEPPARVPTFGERKQQPDPSGGTDEYLENLRSLGYL